MPKGGAVSEVNEAIRLLNGRRLKFTSAILLQDGKHIEIQHDKPVQPKFNDETREVLLVETDGYYLKVVCRWADVRFITTEENEETKGTT